MGHTLLEQTPTNIFFPNPKADFESYVTGFKLSEREFEWVINTHPDSRQFLIKHEFIKRLHARYAREGITIPYPQRTLSTRGSAPGLAEAAVR